MKIVTLEASTDDTTFSFRDPRTSRHFVVPRDIFRTLFVSQLSPTSGHPSSRQNCTLEKRSGLPLIEESTGILW